MTNQSKTNVLWLVVSLGIFCFFKHSIAEPSPSAALTHANNAFELINVNDIPSNHTLFVFSPGVNFEILFRQLIGNVNLQEESELFLRELANRNMIPENSSAFMVTYPEQLNTVTFGQDPEVEFFENNMSARLLDQKRVLYGWSRGGMVLLRYLMRQATHNQDHVLVIESPVISVDDITQTATAAYFPLPGASHVMHAFINLIFKSFNANQDKLLEFLNACPLMDIPILVLLKPDDPLISIEAIAQLVMVLRKHNSAIYVAPINTHFKHGFLTQSQQAKSIYYAFLKEHNIEYDTQLAEQDQLCLETAKANANKPLSEWVVFNEIE